MNFNTSDYFAYKKNKIQAEAEKPKKPISKLNFLFQLFLVTFIIIFIVIVVFIMKYSAKMDIEYSKGDLSMRNPDTIENFSGYAPVVDEEQRKIDSRLLLIQQEENAPSEAKIISKDKTNTEVIDPIHIDKSVIEDKKEKKPVEIDIKEQNKITAAIEEISAHTKKTAEEQTNVSDKNVIIMSKVLIGRYSSFDEAKKMQTVIKAQDSSLTPFVRKIGDVFSVQMGSFQDFKVAKQHAQKLKNEGFDVWIYQQ